ncbi:MAG: response regulator [Fimbriimonadaceae bacterium]|nr:response regulator [Fimbriimonadaceae bacterium]
MKVLVADDDRLVRFTLCHVLREGGHDVIEVADGDTVVAAIELYQPALVLLDLLMPHVTGWEVLEQLRSMPAAPGVVVLSAFVDEPDMLLRHPNVLSVVEKPVELDQLLGLLRDFEQSLLAA